MVKIRNVYGDEYRGRQGNAVYQKFYGRQIRRLWDGRKENKAPGQEEQKKRFKMGLAFWESLSTEEREALREYLAARGLNLTPQQWAVKVALSRPQVVIQQEEVLANLVEWVEGWDAIGWPYRQKITLTNDLSTDLVGYQKLLELDASKVGANFRWDLGGADLRFYDSDGNKLKYWVESWDEQNKQAKVWVRVSQIPAQGQATIKMYYGNEEAVSESDGEEVFEFFDDFEGDSLDWDKWYHWLTGGSTSVSNSEVTVAGGSNSWEAIGSKTKFSPPIVVEFKAKVTAEGNKFGMGLDERGADGTYVGSGYSALEWYYDSTKGGKVYQHTYESSFHFYSRSIDLTTYHILTLVWTSSKVQFYEDSVLGKEITTDIPSDSLSVVMNSYNSAYAVVADWVRVRKYAEQEPSATFGSEEVGQQVQKTTTKVTVKAIEHVAIADVRVFDEDGNEIWRAEGLTNILNGEIVTRVQLPDEVTEKGVRAVVRSVAGTVDIVNL